MKMGRKVNFNQNLTGVYTSDSGQILFEGKPVGFHSTYIRKNAGIRAVFQELEFNFLSVCMWKMVLKITHEKLY